MRKVIISILIIGCISPLGAQQLFQKTYTTQHGLPSPETTGMIQHSLGQLWFQSGPDHILEYDGYNIQKHHSSVTHFPFESAITAIDKYGIWFCKYNTCSYYKEGTWYRIPAHDSVEYIDFINGELKAWNQNEEYFNYDIIKQEYAGPFKYKRSELIPDESVINLKAQNFTREVDITLIDNLTYDRKYLLCWKREKERHEVLLENCIITQLHDGSFLQYFNDTRPTLIRDRDNIDTLVMQEGDSIYYNLDSHSLKFAFNKDSTKTFAFPLYTSNNELATLFEYRSKETGMQALGKMKVDYVNSFLYSGYNQHWITGQNGLLKINDALMECNPANSGINTSLHMIAEDSDGNIWFGGYSTGLSYFDGDKVLKGPLLEGREENILGGRFFPDQEELLIFNESDSKILSFKNRRINRYHVAIKDSKQSVTGYTMDTLQNGQMVFGLHQLGLGLLEKRENDTLFIRSISHSKGLKLDNVLTISQDKKGRIWTGRSSEGVAVYDIKQDTAVTWLRDPANPRSVGAISSHIDNNGNLWFGTNKGLYFFDQPHLFDIYKDKLFNFLEEVSLPNGDKSMVKFIDQKDNLLVFGNQSAVNFLDLKAYYDNKDSFPIYQLIYGEDIGGEGSEQNTILIDSKGYVWVGAENAATRIDLDRLCFDSIINKVGIAYATSSGKELDFKDNTISVPTDSRNFSISFAPKNHVSLIKNIYYDYDIINNKNDTIYSGRNAGDGTISLSYIAPGKYTLHVKANKHGLINDYHVYCLNVPMTLEENPLFWIILVSSILGTILLFFFNKNKQEKLLLQKDLALSHAKNEKEHLQVQSIISSFNPHFINNSLHWAQSRYRKDPSLVLLIDKLSENIRYIFNSSSKGKAHHSLNEEMNLVNNYVTIQKLRFENSFEFITLSPELLDKLKNTPMFIMQLQIHIENAIEHGLRNRKESSFVKLEIEEKPQSIIFKITDNGAGRQKARAMKSSGTQKGTIMLERLHIIFNQYNKFKISSSYEDNIFEDDLGINHGTRVLIELPYHYNYEL